MVFIFFFFVMKFSIYLNRHVFDSLAKSVLFLHKKYIVGVRQKRFCEALFTSTHNMCCFFVLFCFVCFFCFFFLLLFFCEKKNAKNIYIAITSLEERAGCLARHLVICSVCCLFLFVRSSSRLRLHWPQSPVTKYEFL